MTSLPLPDTGGVDLHEKMSSLMAERDSPVPEHPMSLPSSGPLFSITDPLTPPTPDTPPAPPLDVDMDDVAGDDDAAAQDPMDVEEVFPGPPHETGTLTGTQNAQEGESRPFLSFMGPSIDPCSRLLTATRHG